MYKIGIMLPMEKATEGPDSKCATSIFCSSWGERPPNSIRWQFPALPNILIPVSCWNRPSCSWSRPPSGFPGRAWRLLSSVYRRPDDVDLFVGVLAEAGGDNGGSAVGPVAACLLERQFRALKDGDRFFFTHR